MHILAVILTLAVAILHGWFALMQIVDWTSPRSQAIFGTDATSAARTRSFAINLGLSNAFLGLGLLLALIVGPSWFVVEIYLLVWAVAAGAVAGVTSTVRIGLIQAVPAALALLVWWLA